MLQKALREHECGIKFSIREERSTMRKSEVRNATGKLFFTRSSREKSRILGKLRERNECHLKIFIGGTTRRFF